MIKSVPFELFEPGQTLYFNIIRLGQLEKLLDRSLNSIMANQEIGVNFCLAGLTIGLQHHYPRATKQFMAEKMETYLDNGGTLDDFAMPIVLAIIESGIMGKADKETDIKNVETVQEPELTV